MVPALIVETLEFEVEAIGALEDEIEGRVELTRIVVTVVLASVLEILGFEVVARRAEEDRAMDEVVPEMIAVLVIILLLLDELPLLLGIRDDVRAGRLEDTAKGVVILAVTLVPRLLLLSTEEA